MNEIIPQAFTDTQGIINGDFVPENEGRRITGFRNVQTGECNLEIYKAFKRTFINRLRVYVDALFAAIINQNKMVFDFDSKEMWYICPTVLSAMYTMTLISSLNNHCYRKCIHKNCNTYFLVDNSHPQKRCEKHMKALQSRRQNQKAKVLRMDDKIGVNKKKNQLLSIDKASTKYQADKDIDSYIRFWEEIWNNEGGLLSKDNSRAFILADLYEKKGEYQKALDFVYKIGKEKEFSDTAKEYADRLVGKMG